MEFITNSSPLAKGSAMVEKLFVGIGTAAMIIGGAIVGSLPHGSATVTEHNFQQGVIGLATLIIGALLIVLNVLIGKKD